MSRTLSPPRGMSAAGTGIVAIALIALAALGLAPRANADFTTTKCAGPDILGRGASFARDAHTWFNQNFKANYCSGTAGAGQIDVAYDAAGSGAGRTVGEDPHRHAAFRHDRRSARRRRDRADELRRDRSRNNSSTTATRTTTARST